MKSMKTRMIGGIFFVLLVNIIPSACQGPPPPPPREVTALQVGKLATSPDDPLWRRITPYQSKMLGQDMVEPRQLKVHTPEVAIQACFSGKTIAVRLTWTDTKRQDMQKSHEFTDACAVQFPQRLSADLPAPQMGEPEKPVLISYWRASWQAAVAGKRPDDIHSRFPYAAVDHYPFEAPSLKKGSAAQKDMERRYAPARALGNMMEGPRSSAVQDLVAAGPGSLTVTKEQKSAARGIWKNNKWQVVIVKTLPYEIKGTKRPHIAVAVWQGGAGERGARKARSSWIPIKVVSSNGR